MNKAQRFAKKVKIGLIPVIFIVFIAIMIYKPEPDACFNGIQDGDETGIDCGGFCDKKCPVDQIEELANNVIVNWTAFVEDEEKTYDFVASVSNRNREWGASYMEYTFVIYDNSGEIIETITENSYLMPAGDDFDQDSNKKYIVLNDIKLANEPAKVDFSVSEYIWEEIAEDTELIHKENDIIGKYNESYWYDEEREMYIGRAETKNNSKYSFKFIDIAVVLFNEEGEVISIAKTDQRDMVNGDGWGFEVFWPNLRLSKNEEAIIDTGAYTNVFNKYNYIGAYTIE